jgi:hypothetical protein
MPKGSAYTSFRPRFYGIQSPSYYFQVVISFLLYRDRLTHPLQVKRPGDRVPLLEPQSLEIVLKCILCPGLAWQGRRLETML